MIALLCPGQGSQFVGMGRDLTDAYPVARDTFAEADDALGFALSRICWEGPEEELTRTDHAQPAILVHSVAVWRLLSEGRPPPVAIAAGHSLGEFSAYVAAGSIAFADAVRLVRRRGELMYGSGRDRPGTMMAVLGLDEEAAEQVCARASESTGQVVVPANYNSPGQLVISGDVAAIRAAEALAAEAGARRVIPLNVSGAFHSPLMAVAAEGLQEFLESIVLAPPAFPVLSNVTAEPVTTPALAREVLVRQLTSPVRWMHSVRAMLYSGSESFLEIGPGNVLTGLLRRIERSASGRALGSLAEVQSFLEMEAVKWS